MNSKKQFGDLIIGIDKQIKMNIERDLKQYEIGIGLLQILLYLFSNADLSVSQIDLVKFLKIDKGNISRSIAKLIDRDYLEQDPKNPKAYKLSKKGILLYLFSNADQSVSQIDLVKFLKIDKGNISRSIAKLIDRDYLEQDPNHPKTYKLSKKGLQLQDVIISKFTNLNKTMMKGINEADLNTTINTLSIVMKNLEDLK